jgi:hypothetical protein
MTRAGAERAVTVSALVVFGVYFYRLATEGHSANGGGLLQLGGLGAPANLGRFITGWGFAFLVLSIITEAAPPLGGSLAILVAAGDVLTNAGQVAADVNHKLGAQQQGSGKPGDLKRAFGGQDFAPIPAAHRPQSPPRPTPLPSGAGALGAPPIGGFPRGGG